MLSRPSFAIGFFLWLASCSCGAPSTPVPSALPAPPTPVTPTFEVHEWGLVRGTLSDHLMISGPHAPEPVVVMTKPVLYFHRDAARDGEEALVVDVDVEIHDGRVVERWPGPASTGASVSWHGVVVEEGSCHGSRYPTLAEEPCSLLSDGCEAATLASVETADSDCLRWPPPPGDEGPTEVWNHLFYRGERMTAPSLPLRLEPQPDGTLRVTATGTDPVLGRFVRVRRSNGMTGVSDAAEIASPPAPGQSLTIAAPTGTLASAAEALAESLRASGLTEEEVSAFRRSWDEALFGPTAIATRAPGATATITTTPVVTVAPQPVVTNSVIYVLPLTSADALATLRISPAPTALRRAIVIWLDEASAP